MFSTFVAISADRSNDDNNKTSRVNGSSSPSSSTTPVPPRSKRNQVARACDWCRVHRIKCDSSLPCRNCRNRGGNCTKKKAAEIRTLPHAVRLEIERLRQRVQELEEQLQNATNTVSNGDDQTIRKQSRQSGTKKGWDGIHTRTAYSSQTQWYGPSSAFYFIGRMSAYLSAALDQPQDDHNMQPNSASRIFTSPTSTKQVPEELPAPPWDRRHISILDEAEFREHYKSLWVDSASTRKPSALVDIILALCMQYGVALTPDSSVDPTITGRPDGHVDINDASIAGRWYYRRSQALLVSELESPSIATLQCHIFSVVYLCNASFQNMAHTTLALAVRTAHILGLHLEPRENLPRPQRELRKRIWWTLYTIESKTCMKLGRPCSVPDMTATCQLPADDHELARLSVSNIAAYGDKVTWLTYSRLATTYIPQAPYDIMDTNTLIDLVHEVQGQLWVGKVNETHRTGHLCQWVSTFHPDKLPCQLDGTFHHGAFNAGIKMVFSDGTAWMVRFPRVGRVSDDYTDEKVAMEVTALSLIRNRTTIPVPRVQAWGPAASNPLGLGPFIIMDFVNGVSLSDLLQDPNAERPSRVMREDISDYDLKVIYRQMANLLLQLFKLNFDRIGSLPSPQTEVKSPTPPRPLTFKAHSILQNRGVDTFGDRAKGFATTTEYFQYVVGQDWEQLVHQPNSAVGPYDAKNKYVAFKVLRSLIPDLVHAKYDRCKFKLICDDLGLANLTVRSREDLTVVGVVDLEWSYIGPAQLFGSAPWWLLQDRPVNSTWDCKGDEAPKIAARYFKCLDIFIRILEEEEAKMPGHEERELSSLVKWSQASGAMWLHMLLSSGFNDHRSFPFTQLRQHFGLTEWARREKEFDNAKELEAFASRKVSELDRYDEALEKMEENKALMESGNMTKEEFIANALNELGGIRGSSSFVINHEMKNDEGLFYRVAAWLGLQAAKLR
ncbi:hypothetical protein CFD26_105433 [Aspergillus turcosus]|uniref:Zn(2)-C6 fungal-type domain-containing protein n=1 Tax=Aspergillus turcosus TaxID=1245748 RepID=A0A3R7IJZ3_9EURO|nr:hypothetical protein CFD26_105433 [Aspergillus turcosus]